MSLREKSIGAIYRVATGGKRVRRIIAPLYATCFFAILALFVWLFYRLDGWLGLPRLFLYPYNAAVSIPLLSAGVLLALWCVIRFLLARGTPVPFSPPQELVQTGPYAVTRNPILTGMLAVLLGIGMLLGSICVTFVFTPLFILLMTVEVKCIEEPELERRLGTPYIEYKKRVPMFVPRLKPGRR